MAEHDADRREPATRRAGSPWRRVVGRLTPSLVVGLLAACVAFVVVAGVLRDRRDMTTVLVAARNIPAGAVVDARAVRVIEFPVSTGLDGALLSETDLEAGQLIANRLVPAGEPVPRSAVSSGAGRRPSRVVSLPLDSWGAVGGGVAVGDQVDIIDTRADQASMIVRSATIVARAADSEAGLIGAGDAWLAIEVSESEALRVAEVVQADRFIVVLSTGVEP